MASTDKERFIRLMLLIFQGGTWICKNFLDKEINNSQYKNLVEALKDNNNRLCKQKKLPKPQLEILFPPGGGDTNYDDWDIPLVIRIIKLLFGQTRNTTFCDHELTSINYIRAYTCHLSEPSLTENIFLQKWTTLTGCIHKLASHLGEDIKQQANTIINNLSSSRLDIKSSIDKLSELVRNNEELQRKIADLSKDIKTSLSTIEERLNDILAAQDKKSMREYIATIPVLKTILYITADNETMVKEAENILHKSLKNKIEKINDPDENEEVKSVVDDYAQGLAEKDAEITSVSKSCIIVNIRFRTLTGLKMFLEEFAKTTNKIRMVRMETTLNDILKDEFQVNYVLPEETANCLGNWIGKASCLQQSHSMDSPDEQPPYKRRLTIGIQSKSIEAIPHVIDYHESGRVKNQFNTISESLSTELSAKIRVGASLDTKTFIANFEVLTSDGHRAPIPEPVPTCSGTRSIDAQTPSGTIEGGGRTSESLVGPASRPHSISLAIPIIKGDNMVLTSDGHRAPIPEHVPTSSGTRSIDAQTPSGTIEGGGRTSESFAGPASRPHSISPVIPIIKGDNIVLMSDGHRAPIPEPVQKSSGTRSIDAQTPSGTIEVGGRTSESLAGPASHPHSVSLAIPIIESDNMVLMSDGHRAPIPEPVRKSSNTHSIDAQTPSGTIEGGGRTSESLAGPASRPHSISPAIPIIPSDNMDLQRYLLDLYQTHCGDMSIAMMRPEMKGMLNDLYVQQTIRVVDHRGKKKLAMGELSATQQIEKTTELRVRDIFYSEDNQCKNVYITAEAGYGKSTLCAFLVNIWCSAHSKKTGQTISDDENVMQQFPIMFYINLTGVCLDTQRRKSDQYARLIEDQWEFQFSVKDFLADRNCLIIADALDECPSGLPYRGKQNNSTILITSRPWKVEALRTQIEGKAIDKQIELVGLCKHSYEKLSRKIIPILNSESPVPGRQNSIKFIQEMKQKGLETFLEIPVLLLQILRLWYDRKSIGNSQFEIYSNIVHHQIEINECKEPLPSTVSSKVERKLPLFCSFKTCCCIGYNDVMLKLAKLAFDTLFNKDKHLSMIFDHKQTEYHGLSNEDIQVCLKTGILTHEKLFGKISDRPEKLVQFVHKSHHEYFASFYLSTFDQLSQLPTDVNSVITNLDEALKLDKVLMFVAGINPKMATELAAFILEKYSGDSRIQEYRRTTEYGHVGLVKQVQNLIIAAEEESRKYPNMLEPKLRLDDIFVDGYNESRVLSSLPGLEISYLASIMMEDNVQVEAMMSHVPNTAGLQKVVLYNCTIGCSDTAVKLVPQSLCVLYLDDVNLPHEAWTTLSHKLEETNLRGLWLDSLTCGSHGGLEYGVCDVKFDFTRQSQLEVLEISDCDMSGWTLPAVTSQLKDVYLWKVTIPGAMLSAILRGLPQTAVRVELEDVTVRPAGDIVAILDQIRGSRTVEKDIVEGRGEGELFVYKFEFGE